MRRFEKFMFSVEQMGFRLSDTGSVGKLESIEMDGFSLFMGFVEVSKI